MHHIHTTEGLVIYSRTHGEANKLIYIFTRDLGLIMAIAQGIRLEKSKLRYNICDYQISKFSLVHGKEFWRIVGVTEIETNRDLSNKVYYNIFVPISSMLRRLIQGQEPHPEIFDCLQNCAGFIYSSNQDDKPELFSTTESLLLMRILFRLGYIGDQNSLIDFLTNSDFNKDMIIELVSKRVEMNKIINNALKESQL